MSSQKQRIIDYVTSNGAKNGDEIERGTGIRHQSASPIFQYLIRSNIVAFTGEETPTSSGSSAKVMDLYERVKGTVPEGMFF